MKVISEYRTHNCGELRVENKGQSVRLCGWVRSLRHMGAMIFVDLADCYGVTQVIWEQPEQGFVLGREDVICVSGLVRERSQKNLQLPTGDIEICVDNTRILSKSEIPPFTLREDTDGGLELRMKYRYLDLRRPPLQANLQLRHRIKQAIRNYLEDQGFLDIETPFLIRSTPEGARDFVVPSRMHAGSFYALPQSPQLFKQLLMVSGFDRYYQIVRCFRDEDLRADRQPEFTQLDCEMSFVGVKEVRDMFENLLKDILSKVKGIEYKGDFPILTWQEAISRYGSDKPDTRFGLELWTVPEKFVQSLQVFPPLAEQSHLVALAIDRKLSRKELANFQDELARLGYSDSKLFYIIRETDGTYKSSFDKFVAPELLNEIWQGRASEIGSVQSQDLCLLIGAGQNWLEAHQMLGSLRLLLGSAWNLPDPNVYNFLWVIDFPLFEWNEEEQRYFSLHHPFTAPKSEHLELLNNPKACGEILAEAYDMVLNGVEIGGGSLRITESELQAKVFEVLGFSESEIKAQFGFLLDAFRYGVPPHGGIAFGLDRICALFGGSESIRDFIAFPKNNRGRDLMLDAPTELDKAQLQELGISLS